MSLSRCSIPCGDQVDRFILNRSMFTRHYHLISAPLAKHGAHQLFPGWSRSPSIVLILDLEWTFVQSPMICGIYALDEYAHVLHNCHGIWSRQPHLLCCACFRLTCCLVWTALIFKYSNLKELKWSLQVVCGLSRHPAIPTVQLSRHNRLS